MGHAALQTLQIVDGIGTLPTVRRPFDCPQERFHLLPEVEIGATISHTQNLCGGSDTHPR